MSRRTLFETADELRALANAGLHYAENDYDRDRYERILRVSARLIAAADERDEAEVLAEFQDNLLHLSPLSGSSAALYQNGKVLLGKRVDNGLWDLLGGLTEVGETLAEAATREAFEEAGLEVSVTQLLAVFDSRLWHTRMKAHMYHAVFRAELVSGTPTPSNEMTEFVWAGETNLPELHHSQRHTLGIIFKLLRGEVAVPYYDSPEQLPELSIA